MGAYANNFLLKSNDNKVPDGGTETWDRLQILGGAGEVPAAGSTERMALHPYPVC